WTIFGLYGVMRAGGVDINLMILVVAASMFAPAIATIIVKSFYFKESLRDYGFNFKKPAYHLIAWILPVILALFALFLTLSLGLGKLDPSMKSFLDMLPKETIKNLGGEIPSFRFIIATAMFLPVIINCFFTIGEELGWRGFLQDELKPLGQKKSYFIVGLIWGVWHAPIILMGHNYPTSPYLGVLWMIIFCVLLSYIFGWLKDKAGSIFAPTIAHASLNGPAMVTYMVLKDSNILLGGMLGITGFMAMSLFVAYLLLTGQME
ncbi:CPBP family intramembrane glutamic endopeptidase, partial [Candidatus Margulisiibacteriota bacterium]